MTVKEWKQVTSVYSGKMYLILTDEGYKEIDYFENSAEYNDYKIKEVGINYSGEVRVFI